MAKSANVAAADSLPVESTSREVVVQKWEESESGWGTRPDGFSLHLTEEDRGRFIEAYWNSMPDAPPDEYSRPDGTPYLTEINEKLFREVSASECGVRKFGKPPGSGGPNGWVPTR